MPPCTTGSVIHDIYRSVGATLSVVLVTPDRLLSIIFLLPNLTWRSPISDHTDGIGWQQAAWLELTARFKAENLCHKNALVLWNLIFVG